MQYTDTLVCDGLKKAGGRTDREGHYEQIINSANNPNGGGGKGQRHWLCDTGSVAGGNSGGVNLSFTNPQTNIWMRFYTRWESGFNGVFSYYKKLYLYDSTGTTGYIFQVGYPSTDGINLAFTNNHYYCTQCGWGYGFYPTGNSDGSWVLMEYHLDIQNNIFQAWINDSLVVDRTDVDYASAGVSDLKQLTIGSNSKYISNGRCMYDDFDDLAVSTTGYIGPINSTPTDITPPVISSLLPSGTLVSGTTSTTLSLITDENSTCKYSTNSGTAYNSMTGSFTITGGTIHSATISGLSNGNTYNYYVKCSDTFGNSNTTDANINFSVASSSISSNLLWSTTFDCDTDGDPSNGDTDWLQYSDPLVCDGLGKYGSWTTSEGYYEQIIAAADYSGGSGGKGQRHWIGDVRNENSGSILVSFNNSLSEFWARWYVRYQSGMKLTGSKMIYFHGATEPTIGYFNFPYGSDGMRYYEQDGGLQTHACTNCGWQTVFGSDASDGSWHLFEVHMKHETTVGGNDGVLQIWRDESLVIDVDYAQFGDPSLAFGGFTVGSNNEPNWVGASMYQDFDDIAISTAGYIGPVISTVIIRADSDNNSIINTTDAMLALRKSMGLSMNETNWHSSTTTGDANCDNTANSADAMLILRYSLGLSMNGTNWCE